MRIVPTSGTVVLRALAKSGGSNARDIGDPTCYGRQMMKHDSEATENGMKRCARKREESKEDRIGARWKKGTLNRG